MAHSEMQQLGTNPHGLRKNQGTGIWSRYGDEVEGWVISGCPPPNCPGRGKGRRRGNGYISRLGELPDCPELCCEDEGDIIGIRASAEPGNECRFKCLDAKFTKGIGEREGGRRGGGECGEGALQRRVEEGSGLGGDGWERGG